MVNKVAIKHSNTTATPPALDEGELAYSTNSDNLFIGGPGATVVKIGGHGDVAKLAGIEAGAQVNTVVPGDLTSFVANTRTVNGHALTSNVTVTASDVSLGNVTNESKATMFSSPTFTGTVAGVTASMVGAPSGSGTSTGTNTGDQNLSSFVANVRTVNGHALTSNVTVTASDVSLGNVTNESKATMFSSPTFTGTVTLPTSSPTATTEAASKGYVDSVAAGMSFREAVKTATSAPGTFATSFANGQVINGVTLATGNRILIKDQTDQTQNGIYDVAASGAPTRSADSDNSPAGEVKTGMACFVTEGSYANTQWSLTTTGTITIGVSNLVFAQIGGSNSYSNGTGLTLVGTTFATDANVIVSKTSGVIEALSGANLTSLNATNLSSGTVADARLSGNVLLNSSTLDCGTF